jgi:tetratricopeptide (TPR) repeat protein
MRCFDASQPDITGSRAMMTHPVHVPAITAKLGFAASMSDRSRSTPRNGTAAQAAAASNADAGVPVQSQLLDRALAAHHDGDAAESERLCRLILDADAADVRALYLLAVIAAQAGRTRQSIELLAQAIAVDPDSAEAHGNLGSVLHNLRRLPQALDSYDTAVGIKPNDPGMLYRRGNVLYDLSRCDDALASYDRALAIAPDFVDALNSRGNVLTVLKRPAEALASYDRVLGIQPQDANAWNNRGSALRALHRDAEAMDSYGRASAIRPDDPDTLYNLGGALNALGRRAEALRAYDRALAIRPDHAQAMNNRGNVLRDLGRPAAALEAYDRVLLIRPDHAATLYNRGVVLSDLQRHVDALDSFERSLRLQPDYADAHYNRALTLLRLGDFERGWRAYEWRWSNAQFIAGRRHLPSPLWLGTDSLQGKTILLYSEQGLGDTLMFCRYVPLVAARGAKVVLEAQPTLVPLLENLGGAIRVLAPGNALPTHDYHCPLLSLPLAFNTDRHSIPKAIPYLLSDAQRASAWRRKLKDIAKPRVGIAWSGAAANLHDQHRSLRLQQMLPLLLKSVQVVSLQKEVRAVDADLLASRPDIGHFGDALVDFADTAALVELLDLVVTVDTSVAHLAAAMGKTVWILLAFNADWRWQLERSDSPWYPTMRLFRQPSSGDWESVIDAVHSALATRFGARD